MNIGNATLQLHYYTASTTVIIGIFAAIFNILVCWVIFRRIKSMQPLDRLIANLAISDLINAISISVHHTMQIISIVSPQHSITLSVHAANIACKMLIGIFCTTMYASNFLLLIISLERHRAIISPFKPGIAGKFLLLMILVAWILSVIFCIPVIIHYGVIIKRIFLCDLIVMISETQVILAISSLVIGNILPVIAVNIIYIKIMVYLSKKKVPTDSSYNNDQITRVHKTRFRKIIALLLVTALTMAAAVPATVIYFHVMLSDHDQTYFGIYSERSVFDIFDFVALLTLIPCLVNPILYNFVSKNFQSSVTQLLAQCWKKS